MKRPTRPAARCRAVAADKRCNISMQQECATLAAWCCAALVPSWLLPAWLRWPLVPATCSPCLLPASGPLTPMPAAPPALSAAYFVFLGMLAVVACIAPQLGGLVPAWWSEHEIEIRVPKIPVLLKASMLGHAGPCWGALPTWEAAARPAATCCAAWLHCGRLLRCTFGKAWLRCASRPLAAVAPTADPTRRCSVPAGGPGIQLHAAGSCRGAARLPLLRVVLPPQALVCQQRAGPGLQVGGSCRAGAWYYRRNHWLSNNLLCCAWPSGGAAACGPAWLRL